ncbi:MAG: hypothetical protein SPJ88_04080 [Bacilli bacterium]|nr:hypothetical protein [Bacilli bacterium]
MGLSNDLISQFVKTTNDTKKEKTEKTVYGKIVDDNGTLKVRLDGADEKVLTPIITTSNVKAGDRVIVLIKNHSATVIGNTSSPSTTVSDVEGINNKITEFETAIGGKVDTGDLNAQSARIDSLNSQVVIIQKDLFAVQGNIETLQADTSEVKEKLAANSADIETLKTTKLDISVAATTYATITNLEAANATISNLQSDYSNFKTLVNNKITVNRVYSSAANMVVTANGIFGRSTASSERYENSIVEADISELSGLYDLPVKRFKYNDDYISSDDELHGKDLYGFTVEDLENILPCAVQHITGEDGAKLPETWNSNIIIPALLKLIQDLNTRLKVLEGKE